MTDLHRRLLAAFAVEHREHLEAARGLLDALAACDAADAPELVELHRRVHSLKGAARAVDLRPVEELAHRLESLVEAVQKAELPLATALAPPVREALDAIEDWVAAPDDARPPLEPSAQAIAALLAGAPAPAPAEAEPARAPAPPPAGDAPAGEYLRIDAARLDALLRRSAEMLTATAQQGRLAAQLGEVERELMALARRAAALAAGSGEAAGRGEAQRRRLARELDAGLQGLATGIGLVSRRQQAHAWRVDQLGRRLDREMRQARLVPAADVLGNLRKMARDLAAALGKEVRVALDGLETPVDREVLQRLKDPVLHLLRNAVDHGIEPAAERQAAGKPRAGLLRLALAVGGGRLTLTVEDDGRGVDIAGVGRAAVAAGLLSGEAASRLDHGQAAELAQRPGLSTAAQLTEISGRGMGLSIVERAVARLQGHLEIARRAAGGTLVTISTPISASGQRLLLARCGTELFALPAHGIARLLRLEAERVESIDGHLALARAERPPLRLVPLAALLGRGGDVPAPEAGKLTVAVLESGEAELGAVVDALPGVIDGLVRDLGAAGASPLIAGGVVLEDGAVAPVLNVPELIAAGRAADAPRRAAAPPPAAPRPRSILVVDDSITTRTLERSILEANGYRVRLSVDGLDALSQLRAEQADLVIADLEMPRMDGFGLLQAMKADRALAATPVILVTSRDNQEDRRRGLGLGADAYVVKQRFDQRELLETIGQIL